MFVNDYYYYDGTDRGQERGRRANFRNPASLVSSVEEEPSLIEGLSVSREFQISTCTIPVSNMPSQQAEALMNEAPTVLSPHGRATDELSAFTDGRFLPCMGPLLAENCLRWNTTVSVRYACLTQSETVS